MATNIISVPTAGHQLACDTELQKTVASFLANFMSVETQKTYVSDWKSFFLFLEKGGVVVSHPRDVTDTHVIGCRDYLREHFSPTTINRRLSSLSSLFSRLRDRQIVKINPVEGLRRPKAIAKKSRTGFTDQEVKFPSSSATAKVMEKVLENLLRAIQEFANFPTSTWKLVSH